MKKLELKIMELESRIAPGVTINAPGLDAPIEVGGGSGFNGNPPAPYEVAAVKGPAGGLNLPAPAIAQVKSGVVFWGAV